MSEKNFFLLSYWTEIFEFVTTFVQSIEHSQTKLCGKIETIEENEV